MVKLNQEILIATSNKGKIRELKDIIGNKGSKELKVLSVENFSDLKSPDENGSNFEENAVIKAKYYHDHVGLMTISDDSGLEVDILNGSPGIYSARWAGRSQNFSLAIEKIKQEIINKIGQEEFDRINAVNQITANFTCCVCLYNGNKVDNAYVIGSGKVFGHLTFPGRGSAGFGYDPIFIPKGYSKSFAEMDIEEKNKISHRKLALENLMSKITI